MAKNGVSRGEAGIEIDRLTHLGHRALGAMHIHAGQGQGEMGVRIASVKRDRALRQLESFLVISLGIVGPTEVTRIADRDC